MTMVSEPKVERHSITMPTETSERLRERVGGRGLSAYVSEAVDRQLRRDALRELYDEMVAKHGPPDPVEVQALIDTYFR